MHSVLRSVKRLCDSGDEPKTITVLSVSDLATDIVKRVHGFSLRWKLGYYTPTDRRAALCRLAEEKINSGKMTYELRLFAMQNTVAGFAIGPGLEMSRPRVNIGSDGIVKVDSGSVNG